MENTRSYLSRFSGLGLFLLALAVVGVLVWLTVRSANDEGGEVATNNGAETEQTEPDATPFGTGDGEAEDGREDGAATNGNDNDGETLAENESPRAETNGSLPNTGPESAIMGTVGLAAIVWAVGAHRRSVEQLHRSQL